MLSILFFALYFVCKYIKVETTGENAFSYAKVCNLIFINNLKLNFLKTVFDL